MYNQQQFHTANYRGNQSGHDNNLRSDSQQPSSFSSQSGMGSFSSGYGAPVTSQYRGNQRTFQPTGYVQSAYGQGGTQQQSFQQQFSQQSFGSQPASTSAYHTANYRGNQQGHDQYLRSDSQQPNSFQGQSSFTNQFQSMPMQSSTSFGVGSPSQSLQNTSFQNEFVQQQPFSAQPVSMNAFHSANYQGNQPGHDQYLRADSTQPSQFGRSSF